MLEPGNKLHKGGLKYEGCCSWSRTEQETQFQFHAHLENSTGGSDGHYSPTLISTRTSRASPHISKFRIKNPCGSGSLPEPGNTLIYENRKHWSLWIDGCIAKPEDYNAFYTEQKGIAGGIWSVLPAFKKLSPLPKEAYRHTRMISFLNDTDKMQPKQLQN
jgi:hypothetical protein